jgi:hypothetical protein
MKLTNSTFINNTATQNAGVAYLLNANAIVDGSVFTNNTAKTLDAGVFYFECVTAA